jgi:serine O-acetyltransferase
MTTHAPAPKPASRWRRPLVAVRKVLPPAQPPRPLLDAVRARHPRFVEAVLADASAAAAYRRERSEFRSGWDGARQVVRLALVTDAFFALCCYRAEARCRTHRLPIVPDLLHHLSMATGQICVGRPVLIQPGVCIPHGQVVVDGLTELQPGVVLESFVSVGLVAGVPHGPQVGAGVRIGTGARVLGELSIGEGTVVGVNTVVVRDVPAGVTFAGIPGRVVA